MTCDYRPRGTSIIPLHSCRNYFFIAVGFNRLRDYAGANQHMLSHPYTGTYLAAASSPSGLGGGSISVTTPAAIAVLGAELCRSRRCRFHSIQIGRSPSNGFSAFPATPPKKQAML